MAWTEEQQKTWKRLYANIRYEPVPGTSVIWIVMDEIVEIGITEDGRVVSAGLVDKEGISR